VNMGISGNRVLTDGLGVSALARFDRDVLSTPGVKTVVIFEGVNDLGISYGHFEGPMADVLKFLEHTLHPITKAPMRAGRTGKGSNRGHAEPRLNRSTLRWVQPLLERDL